MSMTHSTAYSSVAEDHTLPQQLLCIIIIIIMASYNNYHANLTGHMLGLVNPPRNPSWLYTALGWTCG